MIVVTSNESRLCGMGCIPLVYSLSLPLNYRGEHQSLPRVCQDPVVYLVYLRGRIKISLSLA